MSKHIKIRRGLNINLFGEAEKIINNLDMPDIVAIKPTDFDGVVPKLAVMEGDEVQCGTLLFHDKSKDTVKWLSPVSGEVIQIVRGEKRKVLEIRVLADKKMQYVDLGAANPADLSREETIQKMLDGGVWPFIRQRPFGIIADPSDKPKSIFISAFDTNPLAPDVEFVIQDNLDDFINGLQAVRKLTDGNVHLNVNGRLNGSSIFNNATGAVVNHFSGPHPAGNVGVQIHHLDPINKGEVVWFLYPQDVAMIGRLFGKGIFDATRVVALTGSQVSRRMYYKTVVGTSLKNILEHGQLKSGNNRIISGNVLTGTQTSHDGYLHFYDTQITVIPEGNEPEFIGWMKPGVDKLSMSRTFFSWLTPGKKRLVNTNLHGEERPFVVTGEYEKVFPMDIYPVHLLKSILVEDIELMEKLGIYEVVEEDFALCEFVCTSKIESQDIIRRGIEIIRKEFS
jgi:Na+-transporting NADH:ubiquinone oxidoreductase subunit A